MDIITQFFLELTKNPLVGLMLLAIGLNNNTFKDS